MSDHSEKGVLFPDIRIPHHSAPIQSLTSCRSIKRRKKDHGFLAVKPGEKTYTMVFKGDTVPQDVKSHLQIIHVDSVEEASRFLLLLGDNCEIFLSEGFRSDNPCIYTFVKAFFNNDLTGQQLLDAGNIAELMKKIPFDFKNLLESPLAITEDDPLPKSVNPAFIHKKNFRNALISEPYTEGKFLYFNMFDGIDEFRFDHESDHLQGMLILEAMRQASIAVAHVRSNLPLDGGMTLLSFDTNFYNYIEYSSPVILRAYSSFRSSAEDDDEESFAVCQIFQWGKLCADSVLKACIFRSREAYATHRIRSGKINDRIKRQYDAKIGLMRNTP